MTGQLEETPEIIPNKRHSAWFRYRIRRRMAKAASRADFGESALEAFRQGVSGERPTPSSDGVLLVAANDLYYRNFAITLLLSLERQNTCHKVHLHLCSPGAATRAHVAYLAERLDHVVLTWTADECRLATNLRYRSVYYAAVRFLIASDLLEHTRSPVLCLDVDGIAVQPVWPVYEAACSHADIGLILRPEERRIVAKVLASAAGFNPTNAGMRFASALSRGLASLFELHPVYHVDQIAIFYLMQSMRRDRLSIADIPRSLADYGFGEEGVIWTAKSWKTKNSPVYQDARIAVDSQFPDLARMPAL